MNERKQVFTQQTIDNRFLKNVTIQITLAEAGVFTDLLIEEKREHPENINRNIVLDHFIAIIPQMLEVTSELQGFMSYRYVLENKLMFDNNLTPEYRNAAYSLNAKINGAIVNLLY